MNPRLTIRRHGRKIAAAGALVAVGATTTMALVAGTASAAPTATQPGKCIDNVNVRAEPSTTSKIVAVCDTGKAVQVAETRDGFVHLTDLKGWAAQEFVAVNGKTAPAPAERPTPTTTAPSASDSTGSDSTGAGADSTGADRTPGTSGNNLGDARDDNSTPDAGSASGDSPDQGDGSQGAGDSAPAGGLLG